MLSKSAVSRAVKAVVFALTIPLLAGCVAEQRLSWSPDGSKLAVIGADGLRVSVDGGAHLSSPVEPNARLLSWFPDSKRLAVVSEESCESWTEFEKKIGNDEAEKIKTTAQQLLNNLEAANGNLSDCRDELVKGGFDSEYLRESLLYLRSTANEKMQKLLGRTWKSFSGEFVITDVKMLPMEKDSAASGNSLFTTGKSLDSVRVSPSNQFVSMVDSDHVLRVIDVGAKGQARKILKGKYTKFPDWDVKTDVLYALRRQSDSGKDREEQRIRPDYELVSVDMTQPGLFPVKKLLDLSGAKDKVRATTAGEVLFVARSAATVASSRSAQTDGLFSLSLGSGKLRKVYSEKQSDDLENFDVSLDGKSVSIPGSGGALTILSLKDGKLQKIAFSNKKDNRDVFAPAWRNSDEICFDHLPAVSDVSTVGLYSLKTGKTVNLSASWPVKATAGLLDSPAKQPLSFEKFLEELSDGRLTSSSK